MRLPIPTIRRFLIIAGLIPVAACTSLSPMYGANISGNNVCHERLVLVCEEHTSLHQSCQCMHPQAMRQAFDMDPF